MSLEAWSNNFEKRLQEQLVQDAASTGFVVPFGTTSTTSLPKFPAAFSNAQIASRALPAKEPTELVSGPSMGEFARMVCSQAASTMSHSKKVAAAKNETRLMESLHRKARLLATGMSEEEVEKRELQFQAQSGATQLMAHHASGTLGLQSPHLQQQMQQMMQNHPQMQQQMQMMQNPQMQQQMQQMIQSPQMQQQMRQVMQNPQAQQMPQIMPLPPMGFAPQATDFPAHPSLVPPSLNPEVIAATVQPVGSAVAPGDDGQEAAVFDAVFAAQQAQYMRQLEFMNSMRAQTASNSLIGHPTGPLYECRFADDFRPLQYCKKFFNSEGCQRGQQCTYAHCFEELHPNVQELHNDTTGIGAVEQDVDEVSKKVPDMKMKRKKEICKKWKRDGECLVGKHCPFAHGEHEIGMVELVVMEQVKIKLCKFWKDDKCIYGKRCINAHGEEELGMKKPAFRAPMQSNKKRREGESIDDWRRSIFKPPWQQ